MRQSLAAYALGEGIVRQIDGVSAMDLDRHLAHLRGWRCMVASYALSEGCDLVEIGSEVRLSETEAADAIRAGRVVEVVS